ncbi:MAG: DUF4124 domain-containing protein, partial [Gammaproteobacteria bacterium]|nr:DUF4124 domain-containing protein [Gammaproteobacteria bacterium]
RSMLLCAALLTAPVGATEVYRWVDPDGQAHFSDQWRPGAEKIRIEKSPGFSAPAPAPRVSGTAAPAEPKAASPYEALEIASPEQEEVLWNIEGQLRVSLRVNPELRPGHALRLFLDGAEQQLPAGATEIQLQDVFRGVHTLKAEVVNDAGEVLISSPTRTFMVRQTSLANPVRPIATPGGP